MLGYVNASKALALGCTHHGRYFGIPIWIEAESDAPLVLAKWAPLDLVVEAICYLEPLVRSIIWPDEEPVFSFLVGDPIDDGTRTVERPTPESSFDSASITGLVGSRRANRDSRNDMTDPSNVASPLNPMSPLHPAHPIHHAPDSPRAPSSSDDRCGSPWSSSGSGASGSDSGSGCGGGD